MWLCSIRVYSYRRMYSKLTIYVVICTDVREFMYMYSTWCKYTAVSLIQYTIQYRHCLIILNAATTVTANKQYNDHDQNLGGHGDIFCLSSKKTGGARAPPCPTHLPPMVRQLLYLIFGDLNAQHSANQFIKQAYNHGRPVTMKTWRAH